MPSNGFDSLINALLNFQIWGVFKVLIILALLVYVLFSLVIVRQVDLMTRFLNGNLTPSLKIVVLVHLVFAVLTLVAAVLLL